MLSYRSVVALVAVASCIGSLRSGSPSDGSVGNFTLIKIGGSGFISGVSSLSSANLLLARTDQYGCYKNVNAGQWVQLFTTNGMPTGAVLDANGAAIGNSSGECIPDPSDANTIWAETNGDVYVSTDQGDTWSSTCYPRQKAYLSQGQVQSLKSMGHTIAVDPINSNVVYMSTPSSGLMRTIDKGSNCETIKSVSTAKPYGNSGGGHLIVFDASGGTRNVDGQRRTANIYVSTYGSGVYRSTDGGQTWILTSSGPITHMYMAADPFGNVWFVDNASGASYGNGWKYNGKEWSTIAAVTGVVGYAVAVDGKSCPTADTCHIVFIVGGGPGSGTIFTTNGGSSWNAATGKKTFVSTGDVTWLAAFMTGFNLYPSGAAFDASGHVFTGAEGVFYTTPPTSGTAITFTSLTAGIEESLSSSIVTSSGTSGSVLVGVWDINCFRLVSPYASFPTTANRGCYGTDGNALQHTYNLDWASSNSSFIVALTDNQQGYVGGKYKNHSGTSVDGGRTWASLAAPSAVSSRGLIGGCVAASSTKNFVWAPTDGAGGAVQPFFTTDGGLTWTQIVVAGSVSGWPWRNYLPSKICAADRVNANTFFLYNWNLGDGRGDAIVRCAGGGATCTIVSRPGFGPSQQFNPVLKTVPGHADAIFMSYGDPVVSKTQGGLFYSTNGGSTVHGVPGFAAVRGFGFGAAFAGHAFPAIVVAGFYKGTYGIWRSIDWDGSRTWHQIGSYPNNLGVTIEDIDGDKLLADLFYISTNSGVFCVTSTANCLGGR